MYCFQCIGAVSKGVQTAVYYSFLTRQGLYCPSYAVCSARGGQSRRPRPPNIFRRVKASSGLNILVLVYGAVSQGVIQTAAYYYFSKRQSFYCPSYTIFSARGEQSRRQPAVSASFGLNVLFLVKTVVNQGVKPRSRRQTAVYYYFSSRQGLVRP